MSTLVKKARQFKKTFTREERLVIILSSLVALFTIVFGFMALVYLMQKYVEWTAPYFGKALDNLVGALFEGWTFF